MERLFDGEQVLVTGASGRLGRVVTATFVRAGATVFGVAGNSPAPNVERSFEADLTDEKSVAGLFQTLESEGASIRAIVHTVGMWDGRPLVETGLDRWRLVIDVNLTSTFLVFREALRSRSRLSIQDPLRLIAFASGQGADRGRSQQAAYSASKAGVIRLVESIAEEFGEDRVSAHVIAPSMILFDGMEDEKGIPVQDLANLCLILAGNAGESVNGAVVRAYGTLR